VDDIITVIRNDSKGINLCGVDLADYYWGRRRASISQYYTKFRRIARGWLVKISEYNRIEIEAKFDLSVGSFNARS
jgi:hypothetical protein